MGNFRSNDKPRSGGFRGNRSSGRSGGFSRGGFRERESRNFEGRSSMHETTCDKCKKRCEVPFKPTGDKPVYCSDCFKKEGDSSSSSRSSFNSRNKNSESQSGMSQEQFKEINTKLTKILKILERVEFEESEEDEYEEDSEDSESDEDSSKDN